jgi:methionyl-tRNA formyltransferase
LRRYRTVAMLARKPGLLLLRDELAVNPMIELSAVLTHGRLPKGEGGGRRPELDGFTALCGELGVALHVLDFPAARNPGPHLPDGGFDLLVALSWRARVPEKVLARFRAGAINIHRGALPAYAGAEPVRRALAAGETRIAVTAHRMTGDLDEGPAIAVAWADAGPGDGDAEAPCRVETVKSRLEPLYAPLGRLAIAAVTAT